MPLVDPTRERVSACPVHFIWDGRGRGRAFVRAGFLGILAASALALGASMTRVGALENVALAVALAAGVAWLLGQGLSYVDKR